MYDKARWKPLEKNNFFADGAMARPLPEGTVARGSAVNTDLMSTGKINGQFADAFPFALTEDIVKHGQKQFTTFCTPCHGRLGDGNGMIVQRGFPRPNSFHTDSLRARPVGYFLHVMTNGSGKMYSYAGSVQPKDRWAIAAYIRALQLSQRVNYSSLSEEEKKKVSDTTTHGSPEQHKER
jgi:mono/diheme cytochrome c family protein